LPAAVLFAATACTEPPPREPLREVYSPPLTLVPPPQPLEQTVTTLAADWRGAPGETLRADLASWQGITVVLTLAVILAIAFDTRRPRRGVLIDLLLMFGAGACLFDVIRFFSHLNNRAYVDLLDWVFIGVFALTFTIMVNVAVAPDANVASEQLTLPVPPSPGSVHEKDGPVFWLNETKVVFAGTASVSVTVCASLGPLFVIDTA